MIINKDNIVYTFDGLVKLIQISESAFDKELYFQSKTGTFIFVCYIGHLKNTSLKTVRYLYDIHCGKAAQIYSCFRVSFKHSITLQNENYAKIYSISEIKYIGQGTICSKPSPENRYWSPSDPSYVIPTEVD